MSQHCHHHHCHDCLEELKSEHQIILSRLDDLEQLINQSIINRIKIEEFFHFTETFAEPHHQKEEQVLFPALEKKGIPNEGGPIGMMLLEHTTKRSYLTKMREALQKNNETEFKENACAMISLLRDHIFKENNILYPCAEEVLTKEELAGLASQCEKIKTGCSN